jgi:hypothetical protein
MTPNGEVVQSPRAFIHRSHSGHYGIVNSEEGYQNLTRFLFGELRVDGVLHIDELTLPIEVQKALQDGKKIKASYQFECVVSVRGCQWQMTRRTVREHSAMFRQYDWLFPEHPNGERRPDRGQSPHLFSIFLDPKRSVMSTGSVAFALDVSVLVPDYEVDGMLFLKRHFEGGFILRELILVEAIPDAECQGGWRVKYGFQENNPGKPGISAQAELAQQGGVVINIPLENRRKPGMRGALAITVTQWNAVESSRPPSGKSESKSVS